MNMQASCLTWTARLLDSLVDIANAGNTVLAAHGFPVHPCRRLSAVRR